MKKRTASVILILLALALALIPAMAMAETTSDSAGNVMTSDSASGMTIGGDLYSFGQNLDASGAKIAASAIIAGQNISVNNTTVGGSLRAAGYQVSTTNTVVGVNATLAGYNIHMGQGFNAKAVYAAGQTVSFDGVCETMGVMAQTVEISGTVNGDVYIDAETVNVLDGAVITGNLNVSGNSAPVVAAGASVSNVNFKQAVDESAAVEVAETAAPIGFAATVLSKISGLIMMLPGRIILAVLFYFVIRKSVDGAAELAKTRAVAVPLTGFIALISLPIAAIILLCTYVGIPVGMLLLCLYGLAISFAVSFAGCMTGKLVFPKMHTLAAYMIGVTVFTLIKLVPYANGIITFASMIYSLGYFIQKIYLGFGKKEAKTVETVASPEPVVEAAAEAIPAETDTEAL